MFSTTKPTIEYVSMFEPSLPPYIDLTNIKFDHVTETPNIYNVALTEWSDVQLLAEWSNRHHFIRQHQIEMDAFAAAHQAFKNGRSPLQADLFASLHQKTHEHIVEHQAIIRRIEAENQHRAVTNPFAEDDPGVSAVPGTPSHLVGREQTTI